MILVDANLLILATFPASPDHAQARSWFEARLSGASRVGLPWPSLLAFLRITTNPRLFSDPATLAEAWTVVEHWLSVPSTWIPLPTDRHAETVGPLLSTRGLRPGDAPDAHLAALAIEHGLVLCSSDAGFARFSGLRWENPLA